MNRESRVESRESRIESRESRIENRESRVESRESRVENQESRIGSRISPAGEYLHLLNNAGLLSPAGGGGEAGTTRANLNKPQPSSYRLRASR